MKLVYIYAINQKKNYNLIIQIYIALSLVKNFISGKPTFYTLYGFKALVGSLYYRSPI